MPPSYNCICRGPYRSKAWVPNRALAGTCGLHLQVCFCLLVRLFTSQLRLQLRDSACSMVPRLLAASCSGLWRVGKAPATSRHTFCKGLPAPAARAISYNCTNI